MIDKFLIVQCHVTFRGHAYMISFVHLFSNDIIIHDVIIPA